MIILRLTCQISELSENLKKYQLQLIIKILESSTQICILIMFKCRELKIFKIIIIITHPITILKILLRKSKKESQDLYMKRWMQEYRKWYKEKWKKHQKQNLSQLHHITSLIRVILLWENSIKKYAWKIDIQFSFKKIIFLQTQTVRQYYLRIHYQMNLLLTKVIILYWIDLIYYRIIRGSFIW